MESPKYLSPEDHKFDEIRNLEKMDLNDKSCNIFKISFFIIWGLCFLCYGWVGIFVGLILGFLGAMIISFCFSSFLEGRKEKDFKNHPLYNEYMDAKNNLFRVMRSHKEYWESLDGITFERKMAILFKNMGYQNIRLTPSRNDHGIDILFEDNSSVKVGVQCKRYSHPVGVGETRDFYGALVQAKITKGIFVCTGGYTSGARAFCNDVGIQMLNLEDIIKMDMESMGDYNKNYIEEFLTGMRNSKILETYLQQNSKHNSKKTG